jgi:hypothetical protein
MARPNVSVRILDESLVVPNTEEGSPTIGAMVSIAGLSLFGTTAEKNQGYYLIDDIQNWFSRLQTFTQKENSLVGSSGVTFMSGYLASNGATYWTNEWYAVYNFLQYGAPCYIGFGVDAKYLSLAPDVIFSGTTLAQSLTKTFYNTRATSETPAFGVFALTDDTPGVTLDSSPAGVPAGGVSNPEFTAFVYGEKNQINVSGDTTSFIKTPLSPDIAGCLARTDRDGYPWYSPAGVRRGQILNAVSLAKNLTETQQDNLYDSKVNPVVTFTGEGTILFGDKTFASATSTLSSINVARLVIHLKKLLAPLARGILFEQNDSLTRNRFTSAADSILREIQSQRGISEYKIICDSSNNTEAVIAAKEFVADILIKPIPSINYVKITITNKDTSDSI